MMIKGGGMELNDIHIGMICGSKKGSGTVTWVDGSTQKVYLTDTYNNNTFEVEFSEIIDDSQADNTKDTFY